MGRGADKGWRRGAAGGGGGGDTDTNAAIVGGMLGALHGAGGVDAELLRPVLALDPESAARPRPAWLAAARLPQLAAALLAAAPEKLVVLGDSPAEL